MEGTKFGGGRRLATVARGPGSAPPRHRRTSPGAKEAAVVSLAVLLMIGLPLTVAAAAVVAAYAAALRNEGWRDGG